MKEFTVTTTSGQELRIAAGTQHEADRIAERDGHTVQKSPFQRVMEGIDKEKEKSKLREDFARKHHLVLVHFSPRKSLVVDVSGTSLSNLNCMGFRAFQTATVVFGPDTHQRCRDWLVQHTPEVPKELI